MRTVLVLLAVLLVGMGVSPAPAEASGMVMHDSPKTLPDIQFQDGDGHARSIADFRNKVVLLNVWATWCVPCRKEMPTLDRLQSELGSNDFEVVALSIDRGGADAVRKFFGEIGVAHLAIYIDTSGKTFRDLAVVGLPTTLLIDRGGREIGRLVGPAEWNTPDMIAFIRQRIDRRSGARVR
jgi:thiol-disulfide isomerase/thioredoxin